MALTTIDDRGLKTPIDLLDNEKIRFGTGNDLELYHDGSNSFISDTGTGGLKVLGSDIYIRNASDQDMIHATSGGAVKLYYDNTKRFETYSASGVHGIKVFDNVVLPDDGRIRCGNATYGDLQIYHDGGNSFLQNTGGNLYIRNNTSGTPVFYLQVGDSNESALTATFNGAVELYYDGTRKAYTNSGGFALDSHLIMGDSDIVKLGNGADFQIYHSDSIGNVIAASTGQTTKFYGPQVEMYSLDGTKKSFVSDADAAVELYFNNSKKLNTQQYGVDLDSNLYIKGSEGTSASLYLMADEADDNGDSWRINSNQDDNDLTISNNTSGSYVDKLTILKTGELGLGCIPTQPFYILKSHNGRTKSVVQNNWGSNATAELNLISPTDELAIVKYASGPAHIDLSNSADIKFTIGGSEKLRLQSGGGISFNGDSAAANAIDDYEEGTFTPTVGTTSGTNVSGEYTKIGRMVYIKCFVSWSSHSNSGNVLIGGLPFTPDGSGYAYLGDSRWINLDSDHYSLGLFFDSNGINFKENGDNTNAQNLIWSQLGNDTFMGISGFYKVA